MIRKVLYISLILSIIILDILLFNRITDFANIYPFKRVTWEKTLLFKVDNVEGVLPFRSEVIGIEDEKIDNYNIIIEVLRKYKDKKELNITYKNEGKIYTKNVVKQGFNASYFTCMILVLLFANVYCLWGLFILIVNPQQYLAKIYFYTTFFLGILYYHLIELFTFRSQLLFFEVVILVLGYYIVLFGYNIANKKVPKYVRIALPGFTFFAIVLLLYFNIFRSDYIAPYDLLLLYTIICSTFAVAKIFFSTIDKKNVFIIKRNIVLFLCILISYIIPSIVTLISIYIDTKLPVPIFLSLTLVTPLLIGSGLLQSMHYGLIHFQYRAATLLVVNCSGSLIGAFLLNSLSSISQSWTEFNNLVFIGIILLSIGFLFYSLFIINKKMSRVEFKDKGEFTYSLQNIAESVSSPEDLRFKTEGIFQEIIRLTTISALKLVVFSESEDEDYYDLNSYIEYIHPESPISQFLAMNKKTFIKYQLVENSKLHRMVIEFLDDRDVIFVVPIIKDKEVKGALLVGRKGRGEDGQIFKNDEIHYFVTVAMQLYQLIENDRLYRDYIIQRRYEKELDNASYVQLRLFPKVVPDKERGLDINFYYRPYLRVIGDYFDFFNIDENRTAIIIGDVSGHGLSAAMILSAVNTLTYSMLRLGMSLEKTFNEINSFLNDSFKGIELITLFTGIYNKATKELVFLNAGHRSPIIIKNNTKEVSFIDDRGKILGADYDSKYESSKYIFEKNDELILYTDGIIEIINDETGERLDEEEFLNIIKENIDVNIDGKINAIEKNINYYNEEIKDDITIIGVEIH